MYQGLLALIDEQIAGLDNSDVSQAARRHYQNTLGMLCGSMIISLVVSLTECAPLYGFSAHIKLKQAMPDPVGARYREINESDTTAAE